MPLEIVQREDGSLGTKLPESMLGAFGEGKAVEAFELSCESGKVEQVLARGCRLHLLARCRH